MKWPLWSAVAAALGVVQPAKTPPLWEPTPAEFFGLAGAAQQIERVTDIGGDEFDERVRSGRPFIVQDAGRGNDLLGRECGWYREQFPEARMRAEYTGAASDEKFISVGGARWDKTGRPTAAPPGHAGAGGAFHAPYVWHVKDGGLEAPAAVRAKVQGSWSPAYFLRGAANLREANESQEFWFSLQNGSVMVHADTYCIPAVSLQLRGRKRWRLMPAPPRIPSVLDRYDSHDGGLYRTALWRPAYEAEVQEGEAIVFFPSQFHETFVPEEGNPRCTVATTFQFQHPLPVRYFRAFLPTLANSHLYYEGHCKDLWHSWTTLERPGSAQAESLAKSLARWKTTPDAARARASAERRFAEVDADGDGALSLQEVQAYLGSPSRRWARWFLTEDYFYDWRPEAPEREAMEREVLESRAGDTLHYHDADADGKVSRAEFVASSLQWHVVHHKLKETHGQPRARVREVEERYGRFRGAAALGARGRDGADL